MAENSKIEWCHHTFNPWVGCTKVGPGCDHCYAEGWSKRSGMVTWGPGEERRRTSQANWNKPIKWNAEAERLGIRYRVFCASLADVFDNEVPAKWRHDLFDLILATPHLDWLLVTKRIGNVKKMLNEVAVCRGALLTANDEYRAPDNVWLGITVCNQEEADRDIPKLLQIPAKVRFLSMEPLLGPVDLRYHFTGYCPEHDFPGGFCVQRHHPGVQHLDWVIVGGESGPHARPMHPTWARSLRDQCAVAGVPFLFKQWGEWAPRSACYHPLATGQSYADLDPGAVIWPCVRMTESGRDGRSLDNASCGDDAYMQKVGKNSAGRWLDNMLHDAYPEVLR